MSAMCVNYRANQRHYALPFQNYLKRSKGDPKRWMVPSQAWNAHRMDPVFLINCSKKPNVVFNDVGFYCHLAPVCIIRIKRDIKVGEELTFGIDEPDIQLRRKMFFAGKKKYTPQRRVSCFQHVIDQAVKRSEEEV